MILRFIRDSATLAGAIEESSDELRQKPQMPHTLSISIFQHQRLSSLPHIIGFH